MANPLDFSIITNNTDTVQVDVTKTSDGLPAVLDDTEIIVDIFPPNSNIAVVRIPDADITKITGGFQFTLTPTITKAWLAGDYTYEPVITFTGGGVHTVSNGDFDLTPGVIRVRRQLTVQ